MIQVSKNFGKFQEWTFNEIERWTGVTKTSCPDGKTKDETRRIAQKFRKIFLKFFAQRPRKTRVKTSVVARNKYYGTHHGHSINKPVLPNPIFCFPVAVVRRLASGVTTAATFKSLVLFRDPEAINLQ